MTINYSDIRFVGCNSSGTAFALFNYNVSRAFTPAELEELKGAGFDLNSRLVIDYTRYLGYGDDLYTEVGCPALDVKLSQYDYEHGTYYFDTLVDFLLELVAPIDNMIDFRENSCEI